jgi:membrane protease YdiL (CAAX protease family)
MESADMLVAAAPRQRTLPALLWAVAGAVAYLLAQTLGIVAYVAAIRFTLSGQSSSVLGILANPLAVAGSAVLSTPAAVAFLWGLTRLRTRTVADYLALRWPSLRALGLSALAFLVFVAILYLLPSRLFEADNKFMHDMVSAAQAAGALPLLAVALMVAAPICEELAFRGFLFRTLERKFGATAAIAVTTLGWTALHIQYSLAGLMVVFGCGWLLGSVRRYSGSLYLTMILHAMWNGASLASAMLLGAAPKL